VIAPLDTDDLVLCDFDGTISTIDTGLLVAQSFDFDRFDKIEQSWRRGEISSRKCLRDQWALVDVERADFWELVADLQVDAGFAALVEFVRSRGARFVILSDGLDLYIESTLARLGLRDVEFHANHAALRDGHIVMEFPHTDDRCPDCGNCKTRWLFTLRPGYRRAIYIGDGYSDVCVSRYADVVFAKDDLARLLAEQGRAFVPFATLGDVTAQLGGAAATQGG
jgi:2-hydroxy-3-keto-5-methylthiopentenyl-1-phosphate phosphatase